MVLREYRLEFRIGKAFLRVEPVWWFLDDFENGKSRVFWLKVLSKNVLVASLHTLLKGIYLKLVFFLF